MAFKWTWRFGMVLAGFALVGCAETQLAVHSAKRLMKAQEPVSKSQYKVGKPYQIAGVWYYPEEDFKYEETGIASWYGKKFHGRRTANGEIYDMNSLTAAHRTLPMPSFVRVTNLENGRSLVLRVNDRGPFARGRIIDISRRGSQLLGFQRQGTARVRVQIMADQSLALKNQLTNQTELARVGSPITVDRLPKPKVEAQALPPAGGSGEANAFPVNSPPPSVAPVETASLSPEGLPSLGHLDDPVVSQQVEQGRAIQTNIFIQAGAFSRFDNANLVRAKLSPLGPVKVSQVLIAGRDLYRVRVGPLTNVEAADQMLAAVSHAGYPDARIIVD